MWRSFCNTYEDKINDFNFATLLRYNVGLFPYFKTTFFIFPAEYTVICDSCKSVFSCVGLIVIDRLSKLI